MAHPQPTKVKGNASVLITVEVLANATFAILYRLILLVILGPALDSIEAPNVRNSGSCNEVTDFARGCIVKDVMLSSINVALTEFLCNWP